MEYAKGYRNRVYRKKPTRSSGAVAEKPERFSKLKKKKKDKGGEKGPETHIW